MQEQDDLITRAQAWLAEDPDPETAAELAELIESGDTAALADRFSGTLQFGTAGLRGEIGAGPMRMNRSVVIRAAAGLAAYLKAQGHMRRPGRRRLRRALQVGRLRPRHRGRDDRRRAARGRPAPSAADARPGVRHKAPGRRRRMSR